MCSRHRLRYQACATAQLQSMCALPHWPALRCCELTDPGELVFHASKPNVTTPRRSSRSARRADTFFCAVDLHAITMPHDPKALRQASHSTIASYLAAGIEPSKSSLFIQSHVPQHAELAWLLGCYTPLGWLERMTQFKVRIFMMPHVVSTCHVSDTEPAAGHKASTRRPLCPVVPLASMRLRSGRSTPERHGRGGAALPERCPTYSARARAP